MNRGKELVKNTGIILIGTICTKLLTFFLLPLYTGILSTEEYGIVDLLNTLVFLLIPIVTFQVEQAVFRELLEVRGNKDKSKNIISNGILSILIQCLIFIPIFLIIGLFVNNQYTVYLLLNILANIFSSLFLQISRGVGNTKDYSFASFLTALFTIIFNILFLVVFNFKVIGMLLGTFIGHLICIAYLFIRLKLYNYIDLKVVKFKIFKKLWKYSFPLIPNAVSWWVFSSSDRVIVSYILSLSANGILSVSSKFSSIFITLYNVFDRSWNESISLHINDNDIEEYFNKTFNTVFKLFITFGIGFIACMPFIFPIMINDSYSDGYNLVPILLVASIFTIGQGLLAVIYIAKKNTASIAKTSVFAAVINIIVHLVLINYLGLYASVISTLVAYFVIFIYRYIDISKKYFKVKFDIKFILISLIVLIVVLYFYYNSCLLFNLLSLFIVFVYAIFINKNIIKFSFNFIFNKLNRR